MVKQDVSSYNIIIIIKPESNIKPDESILGKSYNEYIDGILYYYYSSYPDV